MLKKAITLSALSLAIAQGSFALAATNMNPEYKFSLPSQVMKALNNDSKNFKPIKEDCQYSLEGETLLFHPASCNYSSDGKSVFEAQILREFLYITFPELTPNSPPPSPINAEYRIYSTEDESGSVQLNLDN